VDHRVIALPAFNDQEANSALVIYFQAAPLTPKTAALLLVLRRLFAEPAFSYLRTQQQLGYVVSFSASKREGGGCMQGAQLDARARAVRAVQAVLSSGHARHRG
jgi:hypothetical protein